MKKQGIYLIQNLENGKKYYGSSLNLDKRLYEHKRNLRLGQHDNKHLQSSWNKYTEDNFKFEIVEEIPIIEDEEKNNRNLRNIETEYIQKYKTYLSEYGYNFIPGGIGTQGLACSEEKKKKISEANKGRTAYNLGIPMSEEQKELLRKVNSEKYGKSIDIYTLSGVFIETLPSIREVSRKYKAGRTTIQDCCNNLTSPKNLIYRYHGDSLDTVASKKPSSNRLQTEESAREYRESRGKAIDVYNHLGEFIKTYPAVVAVYEDLGISESTIRRGVKEKTLCGKHFFRLHGEPLGEVTIKEVNPKKASHIPTIYNIYKDSVLINSVKYKKDLEYLAKNREKSKLQRLIKSLSSIGDKIIYNEFVIELNLAPSNSNITSKSLQSELVSEVLDNANGEA